MAYRFTNLTAALDDRQSPLRRYLDTRFPGVNRLQAAYRATHRPLLVAGGTADAALVGAAFDLQTRFIVEPTARPAIATAGFAGAAAAPIRQVMDAAETAAHTWAADESVLGRASWALALTTEVYRAGGVPTTSPLRRLLAADRFTAPALLALAPPDALRQLRELGDVAATQLLPHVRAPIALGPTFVGSARCAADADLIAAGTLLDIKTRLGVKNPRTGVRADRLRRRDVYQVLAYALFDTTNAYRLDAVGIYSARYGALVTWPLAEVLHTLAGGPVDIAAARAEVWALLGG